MKIWRFLHLLYLKFCWYYNEWTQSRLNMGHVNINQTDPICNTKYIIQIIVKYEFCASTLKMDGKMIWIWTTVKRVFKIFHGMWMAGTPSSNARLKQCDRAFSPFAVSLFDTTADYICNKLGQSHAKWTFSQLHCPRWLAGNFLEM